MSNAISSILSKISKTTIAAGLAMSLFAGSAAVAGEPTTVQQRAEAAMMQGKDYAAAWAEATRALGPLSSPELAARIIKSESEMNQGKDYVAAVSQAPNDVFSTALVERAQRVEEELNQGKDYVAARGAEGGAQAATVNVSTTGGAGLIGRARAKQ